jgi:hypothetical protein
MMSYEEIVVPVEARLLLQGASAVRIAYGLGALLAPGRMVALGLAPDTHELDDPRLTLRAFGGHQLVIGCTTLSAVGSRRLARRAAALSLAIDAMDVTSAIVEQRVRGGRDRTVVGGYAISGAGVLAFAGALYALGR